MRVCLSAMLAETHPLRADERGSSASMAELALLFVILLIFSEGVLPRLLSNGATSDGSALLRLLWLPVYGCVAVGLVRNWRVVAQTASRLPFLMALIGLSALSFLWSIDPGLSQRRGLAVVMTSLAGLYIGSRYDWRTMLRVFGLAWIFVGLASLLAAVLVPSIGVMHEVHVGAWTGLFFEKNQLGGHMARAAVISAILILMDRPWRKVWFASLGLCVFLVIMSTSKTALLGLLLGLGILAAGLVMRRGIKTGLVLAWFGGVVGGALVAVLVFAPELIFTLLGRDPSLTGRTDIWAVLVELIKERPVLGYGYGAFWASGSVPGDWVRHLLEWDAPTAHNGWFEVTLALGLVGLGCLVVDFLVTVARAVLASVHTWMGLFALAVCAQFLLFSLSESISFQHNSLTWVTYVAVAAKLAGRGRQNGRTRPVMAQEQLAA